MDIEIIIKPQMSREIVERALNIFTPRAESFGFVRKAIIDSLGQAVHDGYNVLLGYDSFTKIEATWEPGDIPNGLAIAERMLTAYNLGLDFGTTLMAETDFINQFYRDANRPISHDCWLVSARFPVDSHLTSSSTAPDVYAWVEVECMRGETRAVRNMGAIRKLAVRISKDEAVTRDRYFRRNP